MTKLVDLELKLIVMTEKAFGVSDGTAEKKGSKQLKVFWLPKSVAECDDSAPVIGKTYEFTMPESFAIDKELV